MASAPHIMSCCDFLKATIPATVGQVAKTGGWQHSGTKRSRSVAGGDSDVDVGGLAAGGNIDVNGVRGF